MRASRLSTLDTSSLPSVGMCRVRSPLAMASAANRACSSDWETPLWMDRPMPAATTTEIAAAAQSSIGSLYQFFPTKPAIAQALIVASSSSLFAPGVVVAGASGMTLGETTAYLAGSEVIVEDVYGLGPWFPLIFGCIAFVFSMNSLNNARLVQRVGAVSLVRRLALVGTCTAALLTIVSLTGAARPNFWLFTVALCLVIPVAQGLTPTCNTIAMTPMPHVAGTASALISTVTTAGGSLLGGIAASQFNGTVRPFSMFVLAFIAGAAVLILWGTAARQPT